MGGANSSDGIYVCFRLTSFNRQIIIGSTIYSSPIYYAEYWFNTPCIFLYFVGIGDHQIRERNWISIMERLVIRNIFYYIIENWMKNQTSFFLKLWFLRFFIFIGSIWPHAMRSMNLYDRTKKKKERETMTHASYIELHNESRRAEIWRGSGSNFFAGCNILFFYYDENYIDILSPYIYT